METAEEKSSTTSLESLRPWQKTVREHIESCRPGEWRERMGSCYYINIFVNTGPARAGQLYLANALDAAGEATRIPVIARFKDLLKAVSQMPKRPGYVCKIPRELSGRRLGGFWTALETIVDGRCYVSMKSGEKAHAERPAVWVMTKEIPVVTEIFKHRFVFWRLENEADPENSKLVTFIPDPELVKEKGKMIFGKK